MDKYYHPHIAKGGKVQSTESWVHEYLSDKQSGDVLDSSAVDNGTVLRTRRYADYVLQKFKGEGSIWRCTSHDLGSFTSQQAFEHLLHTPESGIPTAKVGIYSAVQGSDKIWKIYKQSNGRPLPPALAVSFPDLESLTVSIHAYQGEAR